jgi:hypothetical protein
MTAEFSTKSLQLAIFIHASQSLPYLRTEPDNRERTKMNFIFLDNESRGSQIQLDFQSGASVVARNLFASQTFLRQQMSEVSEKSKNGESSNGHRLSPRS